MPGHRYRITRAVAGRCPGCGGPRGDGWQCPACEAAAQLAHRRWRWRRALEAGRLRHVHVTMSVTL